MNKRLLLLIFVLFSSLLLNGQNEESNRQKYWFFREKLTTDFLKIGGCQGCSIPAELYELVPIQQTNGTTKIIRKLNFGADAPANLGWYIGVLATEYFLLQSENKSTLQTKKELYYALLAIDRLDANAEIVAEYRKNYTCFDHSNAFFNNPVKWDRKNDKWLPVSDKSSWADSAHNLNGYFLRMDGSPALFSHFKKADIVNAVLTRPKKLNANEWDDYEYNPAKIEYSTAGYRKGNNESSQDQVFHLLMGLILTVEFTKNATYEGIHLSEKAITIGRRILSNYDKNFQIKNPVTGKTVCVGGNSAFFSPSLSKIMRYFESSGTFKNHQNTQSYLKAPFTSVCAANGEVNRSLFAVITALSNTTSHTNMCKYVTKQGYYWGFYYLLRKAIYPHSNNKSCDYTFAETQSDLNSCPPQGAFWNSAYFKENPSRITNWTFNNRYLHQCRPKYTHPDWEFNNLDYMLLHNLSRIVYASQYSTLFAVEKE